MNLESLTALKPDYIRLSDPTEYYFATRYLSGWEEWERICNETDFKPVIELWRRELEAKIKSDSLARIIDSARGETRDALQANKFLLDTPWVREDTKRGRPTKADILSEANKIATTNERVMEDYKRISKEDNI